jgi:hypothetical protein
MCQTPDGYRVVAIDSEFVPAERFVDGATIDGGVTI